MMAEQARSFAANMGLGIQSDLESRAALLSTGQNVHRIINWTLRHRAGFLPLVASCQAALRCER
jgi:hypothetical protein